MQKANLFAPKRLPLSPALQIKNMSGLRLARQPGQVAWPGGSKHRNKSNPPSGCDTPGVVVYQATWTDGDHHIWCGDVMEACILGVFEITVG